MEQIAWPNAMVNGSTPAGDRRARTSIDVVYVADPGVVQSTVPCWAKELTAPPMPLLSGNDILNARSDGNIFNRNARMRIAWSAITAAVKSVSPLAAAKRI